MLSDTFCRILLAYSAAVGIGVLTALCLFQTGKDGSLPLYRRDNQAVQRKWWVYGVLALTMGVVEVGIGTAQLFPNLFAAIVILLNIGQMIRFLAKLPADY